ncbi:MAG: hypothetical protein QW506_04090 [Thermoproteota archaeon]
MGTASVYVLSGESEDERKTVITATIVSFFTFLFLLLALFLAILYGMPPLQFLIIGFVIIAFFIIILLLLTSPKKTF